MESLIWDKLNDKLRQIMLALGSAMEEPEDLLQLVLGMAGSAIFDELFTEAAHVKREQLSDWFDIKSGTFGGQAAVEVVKELVGNAAKFDYQGLGDIPKADLPAVRTFFENALRRNGRKPIWKGETLSFVTPEAWLVDRGIRRKYESLAFSRSGAGGDVMGVGHRAFDQALRQALESPASLAGIRGIVVPMVLFQVYDEVTEHSGTLQSFAACVSVDVGAQRCELINDVALLEMLNRFNVSSTDPQAVAPEEIKEVAGLAEAHVRQHLADLRLPFVAPSVRMQLIMWPAATGRSAS